VNAADDKQSLACVPIATRADNDRSALLGTTKKPYSAVSGRIALCRNRHGQNDHE
jgi:hypothetical protein